MMKKITCVECGSSLKLETAFDGCDWDSVNGEGSKDNYVIYLSCTNKKCACIYELGRTKGINDFAELKPEKRVY